MVVGTLALLFALKAALETFRFSQTKIQECDGCIQQHLVQFGSRAEEINSSHDLKAQLHRVCGVVLTKLQGIKEQSDQIIISEVGLDMTKWKTEKQFCSFLGLCPDNSISGGKVLHRATRKVYNRAADTLRLCAQSLLIARALSEQNTVDLEPDLVLPKQSLPWLTILLDWSIECCATDKITSNRASTNTNLNSSYSGSNGSEKKPNHSTFNSFPLSNFHHQFLERAWFRCFGGDLF